MTDESKFNIEDLEKIIDDLNNGRKPRADISTETLSMIKTALEKIKQFPVNESLKQELLEKIKSRIKEKEKDETTGLNEIMRDFYNMFNMRRVIVSTMILVMLLAGGYGIYNLWNPEKPLRVFTEVYALTKDEVSQGADIIINLPSYLNKSDAKNAIVFNPDIQGKWIESNENDKLIFRPEQVLEIDNYYSVALNSDEGKITGDFKVVEPPKILNIFPAKDSETDEYSEITIIFNRPMVPLTTLDLLDTFEIPVEITPSTEGNWKWLGTRTLQFQPAERLQRSSNYTVKFKSEIVSEDGLKVEGVEHGFFTRPLRYEYITDNNIIYNQPIRIKFNQEVDLETTRKEIVLKNLVADREMEFIAEYNTYIENKKTVEDQSTILIYAKQDQFGREKFWDFNGEYQIEIKKAHPQEGDIILTESKNSYVRVSDIIHSQYATTERGDYAALDFFDPEGKLWINFYEEIDLDRSKIQGDKIKNIGYGEKCIENESEIYLPEGVECEKESDKKLIHIEFQKDEIKRSENLEITLENITNAQKQKINHEPIDISLLTIPDLQIYNIKPEGEKTANLNNMTICSSTPLEIPDYEKIEDIIKTNNDYKFERWGSSYRILDEQRKSFCNLKEFETNVNYYLAPKTDYQITLDMQGVFDEQATKTIKFTTGAMPKNQLNFYHYQNNYSVTTPEKTKLTFAVENMEYIDLKICELSPVDMLEVLKAQPYYTDQSLGKSCIWAEGERIELNDMYWDKNYFQITLADYLPKKYGHYALIFSNPEYRDYDNKMVYERSYISITDIGVVRKEQVIYEYDYLSEHEQISEEDKQKLKNIYWVNDLKTLQPIANARIEYYQQKYIDKNGREIRVSEKVGEATTDQNGISEAPIVANAAGTIIYSGDQSAIVSSQYGTDSDLIYAGVSTTESKIYIYTDRPIYRPGDQIFIKGIIRRGFDGEYKIPKDKKIKLEINDSRYENIVTKEVDINENGTFNTSIHLESSASLGNYNIYADYGWANFEVEEYVPAAFKTEASLNKEEYIAGEEFEMKINAEYYFGVPLEGGEVEYSIISQDYYFDKYEDEYFQFGTGWYRCWYDCEYGDKYILRGKTTLSDKGQATIKQKLDFEKFFKEEDRQSKIFVVNFAVKNLNGQSISGQKSFIAHQGDHYLGIKADQTFIGAKEQFNLKIKTVDTNGKTQKINDINLKIFKITWAHSRREEVDGGYYYQWEKQWQEIDSRSLSTDNNGDWNDNFTLEERGEYEIKISSNDKRNNKIISNLSLYVYEKENSANFQNDLIMPHNDTTLDLVTENNTLKPGEKGQILIKNPFKKAKALIAIERGQIFKYEIIDIDQEFYKYEFNVHEKHIPNVYVSVTLISPDPAVKHGMINFRVESEMKELNIDVQTDKEKYLPGEEVTMNIKVTDYQNQPVETELSAAVVDLSVLALKGNPKKNPLVFFYNNLPLTIQTSSNLKNILQEIEIKKGKGGGGGGDELETKKRGEFKDTAFWQAVIKTDKNGEASVKFTLPDNLTTWQIESVGISADTKVGVDYREIVSRKNLMLVPIKPRFIVPGDEFLIGAKIFNQSEDNQNLGVGFSSETLIMQSPDKNRQTIKIDNAESEIVYFRIKAPDNITEGEHKFVLSAHNENLEDTVEQTIKITRNDTYESIATANYSNAETETEYVYLPENIIGEKGKMEIKTSATLAVFISKGLESLFGFPYGCAEQISSKLNAIAIVQRGLALENMQDQFTIPDIKFNDKKYSLEEAVEKGLSELYAKQKAEGGFGYYGDWSWSADYYLTVSIAQTLINLQKSGYQINENKLNLALSYIEKDLKQFENREKLIAGTYVLSQSNIDYKYYLERISKKILSNSELSEKINNTALAQLAIIMAKNPDFFDDEKAHDKLPPEFGKNDIFNMLENRIKIDARGAFLPESQDRLWSYYETTEKNTALLLQALIADQRDNKIIDRHLRWLMNSRDKDGAWHTTNNTLTVIEAMTDYLIWQEENESNFHLSIVIDGEKKSQFDFKPETILEQKSMTITPLSELKTAKLIPLVFNKKNNNEKPNNYYYDIMLQYFLPINSIPPRDEGFTIMREFYSLDDNKHENPLTEAKVGEVLKGRLNIIVPEYRTLVSVEDFIPAGFELVNFNLNTENPNLYENEDCQNQECDNLDSISGEVNRGQHKNFQRSREYYPQFLEMRDDRLFMFTEQVSPGVYVYEYYVRALVPGIYHHLPAVVSEMYFPENFARTRGDIFEVKK